MPETGDLGFQDAFACLASKVLDEPKQRQQQQQRYFRRFKMSAEPFFQRSRSGQRQKCPTGGSGNGMQAIFLESGQKSCGTGVFIPRTNKPACSPVLLPARVVQALNLNVHKLRLHISPNQERSVYGDTKNNEVGDARCENEDKEVSSTHVHYCVISQNSNSSADVFLPKEWTY